MTKTLQEHFDFVVSNLLKQGRKSQNLSGPCRLRDHAGNKCAVGWLIPDERYALALEGDSIMGLQDCHVLPEELCGRSAASFLAHLQDAHDNEHPATWPAAFARVAARFNLSPAVCNSENPS